MKHVTTQVVKEQVVKEQVVRATSLSITRENKRLIPYRSGTDKRTDNKTQPETTVKSPDSLRREARQAAGAAPTLRYGPAGDSAPSVCIPTGKLPGPHDGQQRAARCLTDSSARSWSSSASVSPAPGRGPARFPRPILDARLGDRSRVAICVPPASPHVAITVRPFGTPSFSAAQLIAHGALPAHIPDEAERVLHTRRNILVSGGTASGNTTLLNVLIALLPDDQRIIAIEDTLELPIDSPNRVRFEARRLQQGAVTIRDLVRHALRHRPDHIVVGEVRGTEAADLLQALNTGHGGSPATPPPR